jgi:hypothetical protein
MIRKSWGLMMSMPAAVIALVTTINAATVTRQVYVTFDGSLAGTTYTLGPGELDNSLSFASNGAATVSGGVGDVPGNTDFTSGFYFDGPSLGVGSLQTANWISEAVMTLDVPVAQQPDGPGGEGDDYNHFLDVRGDLFYRFNGDGQTPKITQFGYWNGSSEPSLGTPDPTANQPHHVALVWTAATNQLEAFLDGASQGAVSSASPFEVPSRNVGYGFFSRFLNRAMDGKLDAVAFSTFDGAFNPATDFQLRVIPEPHSIVLIVIGFLLMNIRMAKR